MEDVVVDIGPIKKKKKRIRRRTILDKDVPINIDTLTQQLGGEGQLLLDMERSNSNTYATKKSVQAGLLNTSVIQSQIGILVNIFYLKPHDMALGGFAISTIVLIGVSICLQLLLYCLITLLMKSTTEQVTKHFTATTINDIVTFLTGLSLILNIAITYTSSYVNSLMTIPHNTTTST